MAITDLIKTFGPEYPKGKIYLNRLKELEAAYKNNGDNITEEFNRLKKEALLANPLLKFDRLFLIKRAIKTPKLCTSWYTLGMPYNHTCNSLLKRSSFNNEIATFSPIHPDAKLTRFYHPNDKGYVGEIDIHWDADRMLFSKSDKINWKVWEIKADGTGLRQVSKAPDDVDCFDACYLPNGRIIFGCTAPYQSVPCWHGRQKVSNLYIMDPDGGNMRQLCFDQDHDFHPTVLNNGQVLYHRWEYTGINHIYLRLLMVMRPDGTGQSAVYGSNSWYPNALYFPKPIPGSSNSLIAILSGYHGPPRMGQLVLVDTNKGWYEADGLVKRISGRGDPIKPMILDRLIEDDWPKFLHPFPLSDKYFLVSCLMDEKSWWGIYLADVFDNLVLVREEPGFALLEPTPLMKTSKPPVIPDKVDLSSKDGIVYLHDVYRGPGLQGVPRGVVKSLRILAYHFGYIGLAGPDKVGYKGPWEVMQILGTVPLEEDGSAIFKVPANTPVAIQALDSEGKAVQLMRSWFTAMPGEIVSCVGCHESPAEAAPVKSALAARKEPQEINEWYGPARGFDFAREVQPVLNKYCVTCHNGRNKEIHDLRPKNQVKNYSGRRISDLAIQRLEKKMKEDTKGILQYTPAYDALIKYIRRVGVEDDVSMLVPGEYHADTSPLVQMLRKGHKGVQLDKQAWDHLITWIDLNGPCHGTWGEVYPIPNRAHERRMELRKLYGGPEADPEYIHNIYLSPWDTVVEPKPIQKPKQLHISNWPLSVQEAKRRQSIMSPNEKIINLGNGITMKLVLIPSGHFVMGDASGEPDEYPVEKVVIEKPFWMGIYEVTNEQFRVFDQDHDCRYYAKRHKKTDDQGLPLNGPKQPVVRVSWEQAVQFCRWLSQKTKLKFNLPTEALWEYACRAGSATPFFYGGVDNDFSPWANVADKSFSKGLMEGGKQITGGLEHLTLEGAKLSDTRFISDKAIVTASCGRYKPNAWGLYDMHGNAAEWTYTTYKPYPYRDDDGRNNGMEGHKVVRGGSFFDNPKRCRSAFRLAYPAWQRVFNVGFRVVCEIDDETANEILASR